jgi:hypothetical protein
MLLSDADPGSGRLLLGGQPRPLDDLTTRLLRAWLEVFPVTQDEHEDDAQDEHVEPDIPGVGSAVRAHGGAVVLTVTR